MDHAWLKQAQTVVFVATFVVGASLEGLRPAAAAPRSWRHTGRNLAMWAGFLALSTGLGVVSALALGRARAAGWGVFPWTGAPAWMQVSLGVAAVDATGFGLHRLKHRSKWLWRLHRVHHSDPALDITSTYRFHPLELLFTWAATLPVLVGLGVPPIAPVIHVLYMCFAEQLLHADIAWPAAVEKALSAALVVPGAHRIHHDRRGMAHNFGIGLSVWDRLLGTWRAPDGAKRTFGVDGLDAPEYQSVTGMLRTPFDSAVQDTDAPAGAADIGAPAGARTPHLPSATA